MKDRLRNRRIGQYRYPVGPHIPPLDMLLLRGLDAQLWRHRRLRNRRKKYTVHSIYGAEFSLNGAWIKFADIIGPITGIPKLYLDVTGPTKGTLEVAMEWFEKERDADLS